MKHYGVDWSKGSPPYTWGALSECLNWERNPRITPIYMGSTQRASRRGERVWDHPHIHGEHSFVFDQATVSSGSPPYTWGARRRSYQDHCQSRITPIYMGSTVPNSNGRIGSQDHPHIHGEHNRRREKWK